MISGLLHFYLSESLHLQNLLLHLFFLIAFICLSTSRLNNWNVCNPCCYVLKHVVCRRREFHISRRFFENSRPSLAPQSSCRHSHDIIIVFYLIINKILFVGVYVKPWPGHTMILKNLGVKKCVLRQKNSDQNVRKYVRLVAKVFYRKELRVV